MLREAAKCKEVETQRWELPPGPFGNQRAQSKPTRSSDPFGRRVRQAELSPACGRSSLAGGRAPLTKDCERFDTAIV
jgi:hypothetical protein